MRTFTPEQVEAVAGWFDDIDSHGIYLASTLADLGEHGVDVLALSTHTHEQTRSAIERRGLGGTLAPDTGERLCVGHEIAREVALQITGQAAGDAYSGRGSSFRANVKAIREAATTAA